MPKNLSIFLELEALIAQRANSDTEHSYTKQLVKKGLPKITKKLGEEASEVIIAALVQSNDELRDEIADLMYHLLVLMHVKGLKLANIGEVLQSRLGVSGLDEKANRAH